LTARRGIEEDQIAVEPTRDTSGWRERAAEHHGRGEYRACREVALARLAEDPDDVEALRYAGRAGVELAAPDAVAQLRRVAELEPSDAASWRDVGDALAAEGRTAEAEAAWKRVAELRPDDSQVLTALGHTALAAGNADEAAERLREAAAAEPRNATASISLVDLYRDAGRPADALTVARSVFEIDPDDVLAGLDVAELSLAVGDLEGADATYERLLALDEEDEVYIRCGQMEVALRREAWGPGSELAAAAARVDSSSRTQQLLMFFADRTFGSLDRSATSPDIGAAIFASQSGVFALPALDKPPVVPEAAEIERLLAEARAEHRRIHVEERALEDDRTA
jgi:tetratricopeptide (TPR) repeat protein